MLTKFHHSGLSSPLIKFIGVDSHSVFLSLSNVVLFSEFVQQK